MIQDFERAVWRFGWVFFFFAGALTAAPEESKKPFFQPTGADSRSSQAAPADPFVFPAPRPVKDEAENAAQFPIRIDVPYSRSQFAKDLLLDQLAIWRSPADLRRSDLRWMIPVGLGTAAVAPFDQRISDSARGRFEGGSRKFAMAGGPASMATAAGLFAIGHFAHKPHLRETGLLGVRATVGAWVTVKGIKAATNRERPERSGIQQHGEFWSGGKSFPSGHSAETWALATVVAEQYSDKPWIRFGAYAFAAGISVSRVTGQNHFPTDVIIGGLIGHLIGRHVVRSWRGKRNAEAALRSARAVQP